MRRWNGLMFWFFDADDAQRRGRRRRHWLAGSYLKCRKQKLYHQPALCSSAYGQRRFEKLCGQWPPECPRPETHPVVNNSQRDLKSMAKQRPPKDKKTAHHQKECVAVDKSLIMYVMFLRVTQQIHRLPAGEEWCNGNGISGRRPRADGEVSTVAAVRHIPLQRRHTHTQWANPLLYRNRATQKCHRFIT